MNKNQLERIRKKVEEIKAILEEDISGCPWIQEPLEKLTEQVNKEIHMIVCQEYEMEWEKRND